MEEVDHVLGGSYAGLDSLQRFWERRSERCTNDRMKPPRNALTIQRTMTFFGAYAPWRNLAEAARFPDESGIDLGLGQWSLL